MQKSIEDINWLSYIIVIILTIFVTSILTENSVIDRLIHSCQEGIQFRGGRFILKQKNYQFVDMTNKPE